MVQRLAALLLVLALIVMAPDRASATRRFGGDGTTLRGKFRALVVWVQDYNEWMPLSAPKKDAERIAKILVDRYLFEKGDVEILGNPNQAELFKAVKAAAVRADEGDSLLVVFAGHGYLENETGQGYWIPRDGKRPGPAAELTYLSSSWVRDVLKGSKALHVALISDSCFSGALLASRGERGVIEDSYYGKAYVRRSFEALTSGALETVDDTGAPGGHSPFAYYLAAALESPDGPVFDIQDLYQRVRSGVKELSKQTPLFGKLAGAPSDGGAFVFVSQAGVKSGSEVGAAVPSEPGARTVTPAAAVSKPEPVVSAAADAWTKARAAFSDGKFGEALKIILKGKLCEGGSMDACYALGEIYAAGLGTRADAALAGGYRAKAVELARGACEAGDQQGCLIAGLGTFNGWVGAADIAGGKRLLQRACDLGSARACYELAVIFEQANDRPSALGLFEKGCETGEPASCYRLGEAHENGWGVAKSDERAVVRYREACEGGYVTGCADLGAAAWLGTGTPKDPVKAHELVKRACDAKDDRGCTVLGMILAEGAPTLKKDEKRAVALWQTSCERNFGQACFFLGLALHKGGGIGSRTVEAVPWLTRGCELNDADSCAVLGKWYDEGTGVDWDADKGKALLKKACELGAQSACEGFEDGQ